MVSPGPVVFKEALKLKRKSFKEAGETIRGHGPTIAEPCLPYCGGGGAPPQLNRSSDYGGARTGL